MTIPEDITLLISRRWAGETLNPTEEEALTLWLSTPEHAAASEDLRRLWSAIETYPSHYEPDIEAGWHKLRARIESEKANAPSKVGKTVPLRRRRFVWLAAAASLFFLLMAGYNWWIDQQAPLPLHTVAAASGSSLEIALPDGSLIVLHDGSELSYPDPFEKSKHRWVELSGEAYFHVAPNPKKPFRIVSGHALTEVIGTSFNVRAIPGEHAVEVTVESGKVQLMAAANPGRTLMLQPGDRGQCTPNGELSKVVDPEINALSWLNGKLRFRKTLLPVALQAIGRHYGVEINMEKESLRACTYTGYFEKTPMSDVFQTLELTYNARIVQKADGSYLLRGGTCR